MPKHKINQTISKRFKKTAGGKLLRRHARTSHLSRKESVSRKHRKARYGEVYGAFEKKIEELI